MASSVVYNKTWLALFALFAFHGCYLNHLGQIWHVSDRLMSTRARIGNTDNKLAVRGRTDCAVEVGEGQVSFGYMNLKIRFCNYARKKHLH